jgi:hypothetical protein
VNENYLQIEKYFFFQKYGLKYFKHLGRVCLLNEHYPSEININMSKYSLPIKFELDLAYNELKTYDFKTYPEISKENCLLIDKLNYVGIAKLFMGKQIDESDYITLPRYKVSWILPNSFDDFVYNGGVAGVIACLVGYLLGYKKILLLGMDCDWKVTNNVVNTQDTYWFANYFNQKEYNIKDFCSECTPESLQKMHLTAWQNLKEMIEINELDLEIVNCTPNSKITCFKFDDLKNII